MIRLPLSRPHWFRRASCGSCLSVSTVGGPGRVTLNLGLGTRQNGYRAFGHLWCALSLANWFRDSVIYGEYSMRLWFMKKILQFRSMCMLPLSLYFKQPNIIGLVLKANYFPLFSVSNFIRILSFWKNYSIQNSFCSIPPHTFLSSPFPQLVTAVLKQLHVGGFHGTRQLSLS